MYEQDIVMMGGVTVGGGLSRLFGSVSVFCGGYLQLSDMSSGKEEGFYPVEEWEMVTRGGEAFEGKAGLALRTCGQSAGIGLLVVLCTSMVSGEIVIPLVRGIL